MAFNIESIVPAVAGGLVSAFGIGEKRQDRRQLRQQQALNAMDMENAEKLRQMQMQTWKDTNYSAQMEEARKAGLSMSIFGKGGGGGGGTMASPPMTNSGQAASGPAGQMAGTQQGMAIAQLGLMKAQKENIEADTANKQAGAGKATAETKLTDWENAVREQMPTGDEADTRAKEQDKRTIDADKANAEWEAYRTGAFDGKPYDSKESPIAKATKAGFDKAVTDLQNSKTAGDIAQATKIIEEFKANLAKEGISPDSPWWAKIIGNLLGKIGINPINLVK